MTKSSREKYTDPGLRDQLKEEIQAGDKGGKPGQWSARKAQLLATEYKSHGGSYHGPKDSRAKHLDQWTKEEWQTKDGDSNAIVNDNGENRSGEGETHRYLPKKAWDKMSEEEKEETDRVKVEGSKAGKQFVPNTKKAAEARREAGMETGREMESSERGKESRQEVENNENGDKKVGEGGEGTDEPTDGNSGEFKPESEKQWSGKPEKEKEDEVTSCDTENADQKDDDEEEKELSHSETEKKLNSEQGLSNKQDEIPDSNTKSEDDGKIDTETDSTEKSYEHLEKGQQRLHGKQGKAGTPGASDGNANLNVEQGDGKRKAESEREGSQSEVDDETRNVNVRGTGGSDTNHGKKQAFKPKKRKVKDD